MIFARPLQTRSFSDAWAAASRRLRQRIRIGGRVMKRRDWLLLFAAYEGAPDGLDPIRFQKGLFLFAKRARAPERSKYVFKPYDYGPMSAGIYSDLDRLVNEGLLERVGAREAVVTIQAVRSHVSRGAKDLETSREREAARRSSRAVRDQEGRIEDGVQRTARARLRRLSRVRSQLHLP